MFGQPFQRITPEQVLRMPGNPEVDYMLDRPPYTRYRWDGSQMVELGAVSGAGSAEASARAVRLHDNPLTPATRGTLIVDWSSSYSGAANTLDSSPIPGGSLSQITSASQNASGAANGGAQSSTMRQVGFWAMSNKRASGQAAASFFVDFGADNTFAATCFFGASIPCDGKWYFITSPAQVAWGTSGGFVLGNNFTHVRIRESASLATGTGRPQMTASDRIVVGPMFRDPGARAFGYVRFDDQCADQYVARQTLAADFVGRSGVTIPAGVPQSGLSVCQAFGLKATAYILTRHVNQPGGFLTSTQLRDLQDTYGWCIGFQSHANSLSSDNMGLRLLGNIGFTIRPVGGISAVNTGTGVITAGSNHNITTTTGVAGEQGYPVTLIGADFPVPASGAALQAGDTVWLRNVAATTFTMHRTETESCNNTNIITFSSAGTPANWGYRYRGSAADSSAIAADFSQGQALMQGWGLNGWRHYAPNQGAFGLETESVLLSMRSAGTLRTGSGTYGSTGITKADYTPRVVHAYVGAGPGASTTGQFGTNISPWLTVPSNIDTHAGGVDAEAAIRAYVDDCVTRGAICGNYHHHFSSQASLRNFIVYCDQVKLRVDQGVMETGTMDDLYNALVAARTA